MHSEFTSILVYICVHIRLSAVRSPLLQTLEFVGTSDVYGQATHGCVHRLSLFQPQCSEPFLKKNNPISGIHIIGHLSSFLSSQSCIVWGFAFLKVYSFSFLFFAPWKDSSPRFCFRIEIVWMKIFSHFWCTSCETLIHSQTTCSCYRAFVLFIPLLRKYHASLFFSG